MRLPIAGAPDEGTTQAILGIQQTVLTLERIRLWRTHPTRVPKPKKTP